MRLHNLFKRITALVVCMALFFGSIPIAANAAESLETNPASDAQTTNGGNEVIALREENIKHFDMGNGTFQAIAYSHPVHELDSEGNWQDIDFGLTLTQVVGDSVYASEFTGAAFAANYSVG